MTTYRIINYGNTRTVYIKGQSWEITKHQTIEIDDKKVSHAKEIADAFEKLPYVDVEVIEQPDVKTSKKKPSKKKKKKSSKKSKKKVTTRSCKTTKRRKVIRRNKK